MRFDDRFIDELKSRVRLSDTIGKTVKLKRQGREFVGLSPFTKERSPSFFVNDDKGFYHDFSSGKHGDLISFLQETERLSFTEAVERLAGEAGMPLPSLDPRYAENEKRRQGLVDWLELAQTWFKSELRRPVGSEARSYLEKRGLPADQWERFGIGFAPAARTALKDYLVAKGAKVPQLVESGLLIAPEDGSAPYDRFRNRIIFPIADQRGRVVSFGGRAMDPNARAKYLNGPETSLFSKGRLLYGLPEARRLMNEAGEGASLVVVEGYMDAIACQRAGIPAVAPLGTALTEEQMELLWRVHSEPTVSFDGDIAGQRAISRTIDRALPLIRPGKTLKFAVVRGGKDPDEILRESGPVALRDQLQSTMPFVDAVFEREIQNEGRTTPEGIAAIKANLRALANTIQDKDLSEQYRRFLFEKFDVRFPISRQGRWNPKFQNNDLIFHKGADGTLRRRIRRFNAAVAIGAVHQPRYLLPYSEKFSEWGFGDAQLDILIEPFIDCLVNHDANPEILTKLIHKHGAHLTVIRASEIANEIDAPPFFDERIRMEDRQVLWEHCYETALELTMVEAELDDRRHTLLFADVDDEARRSYLSARRILWDRRALLAKKTSDLEWFD
jgi:DNA primase